MQAENLPVRMQLACYRVSHNTGHLKIWLSPSSFINMNWTPEYEVSRVSSVVRHPVDRNADGQNSGSSCLIKIEIKNKRLQKIL